MIEYKLKFQNFALFIIVNIILRINLFLLDYYIICINYIICLLTFIVELLRIILREKEITFEIINEPFWKRRVEFLKINPAGDLPVNRL